MADAAAAWPAATLAQTRAALTGPGAPFEMTTALVAGRPTRVYKNALPSIRSVFDLAWNWGERPFIVYEGERLTFDEHQRAASALARVLMARYGVVKGDRVAIAMRNIPEFSIAFWAAIAIGAVVTPLNGWGTGEDLAYGLTDSQTKVALMDAERLERVAPFLKDAGVSGVIAVRTPAEALHGAAPLTDLIGAPDGYARLPAEPPPDPGLDPDDNATILYTSGTTGKPKGALGTHRGAMHNLMSIGYGGARAIYRRTGALAPAPDPNAPQRAMLLPVPLFHVTGSHSVLIPCLAGGTKLVLMHRWSPERALELIEQEKITGLTGVPTQMWQLLESPDFERRDTSTLESAGYGGAAVAPELTQRFRERFPWFWPGQGYGATETTSVATSNAAEDYFRKLDSVGPPVPVCDVRIVDANDNVLPTGEVGEICVFGPNVVKGYWNKPEATAKAFVDGWYHTGDIGRMDDEGFVYVMDRIKDMLIRGAENIYCVEIEDVLYAHPAVIEAAVIGLPHKVLGEEVGAIVRVKAPVSEAQLIGHCGKALSAYKVPVRIYVRTDELPKNANGKILKNALREEIVAAAG
jgi:long-chain acyl-CoA synthetase